MRFVKQKYLETIRPMDDETEFICDSRYKISIFSNKLVVGTGLNAELDMHHPMMTRRLVVTKPLSEPMIGARRSLSFGCVCINSSTCFLKTTIDMKLWRIVSCEILTRSFYAWLEVSGRFLHGTCHSERNLRWRFCNVCRVLWLFYCQWRTCDEE